MGKKRDRQKAQDRAKKQKKAKVKDRPLKSSKEGRAIRKGQTEKVPAELHKIAIPELACYETVGIRREELLELEVGELKPKQPAWVPGSNKPKKGRGVQQRSQLYHRGQMLDPGLIFNPDDRRTYNDRSYPWGTVCKVQTFGAAGSGSIVGPRHVLTASHVVDWSRNGAGTVDVHRVGGSVAATSPIVQVWAFTRLTGSTVSSNEVDEDYAVLITADRIGDRFGWLGTRTYNSGWDHERHWHTFGYPGDIAGARSPVWQNEKWLDEDAWDLGGGRAMTTDADLIPGQSGSPLFAFWDDGPYVVAVWSGFSATENWCAGGRDLTRLVRHARDQRP